MSGPSTPTKSKEESEDVEDELANPNLYEESMAEITFNETRDGGHDDDPFDRSGEYDEDVNLEAPPPITPDIPEIMPKLLRDGKEEQVTTTSDTLFDDSDVKDDQKTS